MPRKWTNRQAGFEFIAAIVIADGQDLVFEAYDPNYEYHRKCERPPAPPWCSRCCGMLSTWRGRSRWCRDCNSFDVYPEIGKLRRAALKGINALSS